MNRAPRVVAALLASLTHFGACAEPQYESPRAKAFVQGVSAHIKDGTLIEVSAATLAREYDSNEITADKKYKNKFLFVQGTVESVGKDSFENIVVKLKGGNMYLPVLGTLSAAAVIVVSGMEGQGPKSVTVNKHSTEEAAGMIRKGSKVRLLCTGNGVTIGMPMLRACDTISR